MTRIRCSFLIVMSTCIVLAVAGETLAVSVRLSEEPDADGRDIRLLARIEEGAMETLFDMGHIVFDIDLDDNLELSWFAAIDSARAGGARYLVLIDTAFGVGAGPGFSPESTTVTIIEVRSERDSPALPVDPMSLPGASGKTAEVLSRDVGRQAAENALSAIREVSW